MILSVGAQYLGLRGHKTVVVTVVFHEVGMIAHFDDFPFVHDDDLVGVPDGAEAVRDDHDGAPLEGGGQGVDYPSLVEGV